MYFRKKEYFCGLKFVCVSVRARVVRIYTRPMKNIYQRKKHYKNNMKRNTFLLTVFLSMATLAVYAQPFTPTPTQAAQVAMQSQQIMQNGQNHDGTIYAPFDNTMPSEQCGPNKKGGVRKSDGGWTPGWVDETPGPDTPPGQEYPIGEPWVLAAFALLFAGVVWLRGRKRERRKRERKNKRKTRFA